MGTTYLGAVDYHWNYSDQDLAWLYKYNKLTAWEKVSKIISDYVVYIFTCILGVNGFDKVAKKRTSEEEKAKYYEYVRNNSSLNIANEKIVLIFIAVQEHAIPPLVFKELENQYKVVFQRIGSLSDISKTINTLCDKNKIHALWVRAHGTAYTMQFDESEDRLNISQINNLEKLLNTNKIQEAEKDLEVLCKLEQDATIILESCSTGMEVPEGHENVAQFFARAAKGRKVYAPTADTLPIGESVTFSEKEGFKVKFETYQSSKTFSKGSFLSRMGAVWNAYRNIGENITAEFLYKGVCE